MLNNFEKNKVLIESSTELKYVYENPQQSPLQENWRELKSEILALTDFRMETTKDMWYYNEYKSLRCEIESFVPKYPFDINLLPRGILAEVLFLDACRRREVNCCPTLGQEDVLGADFKVSKGRETRFFDVSVNTSIEGITGKIRGGTFPTIFLPWNEPGKGFRRSYAESLLRKGTYNCNEYFKNIFTSNYSILEKLKRVYQKKQRIEIFGCENLDLSDAGILYIKDLEGVLDLIRNSMC